MNGHSSRRRGAAKRRPTTPTSQTAGAGRRPNGGAGASSGEQPAEAGGKRERILDAAVRVFAEQGFYHAKVAQIAQLAGVADGTIYLYFKSKDDLLISLFEDRMTEVNAKLREALAAARDAVDRLRRIVRLHLALVEQNLPMAEVISVELRQSSKFVKEYANPKFVEFLRLIAGAISDGQQSGELRRDVDPQLIARSLFGALDEIALSWLMKKEKFDLQRAAADLEKLFVDGLVLKTTHTHQRPREGREGELT
jgi:TetR/AcrR family fatty acid metabolism transcriptional regulator